MTDAIQPPSPAVTRLAVGEISSKSGINRVRDGFCHNRHSIAKSEPRLRLDYIYPCAALREHPMRLGVFLPKPVQCGDSQPYLSRM
jgi:hypothetical protein